MGEKRNIIKSQPVTGSERILTKLCEKSFLSLWSFPNVYTDDGLAKGQGRELCDLLVVFNEHVLIFSDKGEVQFSSGKDLSVAWPRWVKRAFFKSAYQTYQAEKWIKNFRSRIFLDNKCTQPFPIQIPSKDNIKVHRIVVTRGISEHARKYFGRDSSGTLMLLPMIEGEEEHFNMPFHIGIPDKRKGFVHFLDDESIDIIFKSFDTITDFINYLERKEHFLTSIDVFIAGEEELIGYYLSSRDERSLTEELRFPSNLPPGFDCIAITSGIYEDYTNKKVYGALQEFTRVSYFWDDLIERLGQYAFTGNWGYTTANNYEDEITPLKYMASESRIGRTILSNSFVQWALPPFEANETRPRVRVSSSPTNQDVCYVWLILPHSSEYADHKAYREDRKSYLISYCIACKDLYPEFPITVGLAFDPCHPVIFEGYCEDMVYMDSTEWKEDKFEGAKKLRKELGYFQKVNLQIKNHAYDKNVGTVVVSESSKIIRYKAKKEKTKKKKASQQRKKNRKSK